MPYINLQIHTEGYFSPFARWDIYLLTVLSSVTIRDGEGYSGQGYSRFVFVLTLGLERLMDERLD